LLLIYGAKVDARYSTECPTALMIACGWSRGLCEPGYGDERLCRNPNVQLVKVLLQHNANPNLSDREGHTPLKLAKINGLSDIILLLQEHNANV